MLRQHIFEQHRGVDTCAKSPRCFDALLEMSARVQEEGLVDIIEQSIFETDTGLEAALLASERIIDAERSNKP